MRQSQRPNGEEKSLTKIVKNWFVVSSDHNHMSLFCNLEVKSNHYKKIVKCHVVSLKSFKKQGSVEGGKGGFNLPQSLLELPKTKAASREGLINV